MSYEVTFGLLKLGKFALYSLAGWLTIRISQGNRGQIRLLWALLAGGLITTVTLPFASIGLQRLTHDPVNGFKATNAVSVQIAVLIALLGVGWASGWGGRRWRKVAPWALGLMTAGFAFSRGRGGWLALVVGLVWFLHRRGFLARKPAAISFVIAGVALAAYQQVPVFQYDVNRTFRPDSAFLAKHGAGFMGFDEGARIKTWVHEGLKFVEAPILGRGFYNRFPGSGLWWTGSHNYWLQMLLETGLPGGSAILAIVWILWRDSRSRGLLPVEVALVVAFVGGMGGEYFYGGMPLFVFISALSAVGAPAAEARDRSFSISRTYQRLQKTRRAQVPTTSYRDAR
jgi:O-antigen ligase